MKIIENTCLKCNGTGYITVPVFSICHHFPVLYEREMCSKCNGKGVE